MSLQSSFSYNPAENPHKYFKNLLISFRKNIISQKIANLKEDMQAIINASKDMKYTDKHKKSVFHKAETEKALTKLFNEFERYIKFFEANKKISSQDLLDSLKIVESLLEENNIY